VVGSISLFYNDTIVVANTSFPRKLFTKIENQLKGDMMFIISQVFKFYGKGKIGIFFKEDDFVLCLSDIDIIELITDYRLEDKIVSLAYGFGLVYIPTSLLETFFNGQIRCQLPIDSCLSSGSTFKNIFIKIHPPFAVHKNTISHIGHDEKHDCDYKCFVDCKDAAHSRSYDYQKIYLNVTQFFTRKGIGVLDMYIFAHCNNYIEKKI